MSDSVTKTVTQGYFSRIGGAIGGVLIGIVLVIVSMGLLFWNEGRAVKTARSLAEGASAVVSIQPQPVDPANEGRLVHVTGMATTSETLRDPDFGISVQALRLERNVEMYQWREESHTQSRRNTGGSETRTTTYTYDRDWSSNLIDSSRFEEQAGHRNPSSMRYQSGSWTAANASLGDFALTQSLLEGLPVTEIVTPTQADLASAPAGATISGGMIYIGTPANPRVGDIRVSFRKASTGNVSVIDQQTGGSFSPYQTSAGNALEMIEPGIVSADAMFAAAERRNTALTWGIRVGGFVLIFVGFLMILRPLKVMADVIPFIGSIVGTGTALVAFIVAAPLSLFIIAVAWIVFRPLLGVALLVLGGVITVSGIVAVKKRAG